MLFDLSPDQKDLQARARALAEDVIAPRAAEVDRAEQYPWDNVKALTEAGFMGMTIPKEYGGQGRSFLDAVLVIEHDMGFVRDLACPVALMVRGRIERQGSYEALRDDPLVREAYLGAAELEPAD